MKNARFWTHINGSPVKLTLKPGQSLGHDTGGPTDEGYSFESNLWEFDGETITRESTSGGRDCDGVVRYYNDSACNINCCQSGSELDGVTYPAWGDMNHSVYDQYAQLAGY